MRVFKIFILFVSLTFSSLAVAADYSGTWYHDGNPVRIQKQFDRLYLFCNEQQDCKVGHINPRGYVIVPEWRVSGTLQSDGNAISWSNQTLWTRYPAYPNVYPGFPNQSIPYYLNGRWAHEGRSTYIKIQSSGQVVITNEWGEAREGYLSGSNTIVIPSLNLRGTINSSRNLIYWSNRTIWNR